jgi:hypothetical protein
MLRELYVVTTYGPGLVSWLARKVGGMTWSHAAIRFRWGVIGEPLVIDAGATGVHVRPWEQLERESTAYCLYELADPPPECDLCEIVAYAHGNVGKPYNYWWLLLIAWRAWRDLRPFTYPAHVCSSFVYDAFDYSVDLLPGSQSVVVTPDELAASPLLREVECVGSR